MDILMYIINNILSQAVFILGIVVVLGSVLQKKKASQYVPSSIKAMIGFLLVNSGGQYLGMALLPLQPLLAKIFNMNYVPVDIGSAQAESIASIGNEMALIFALGFLVNILIARFTRYKFVHLSAHVSFFFAGMIAALLKFNTNLGLMGIVAIGSIILGVYMTMSCAYIYPLMKNVKGGEGFTLGHSSSSGVWISAQLGKLFSKGKKDLEEIKLPKSLSFLREMTISLTLVMTFMFLVLSIVAGISWTTGNVSGGRDIVSFALLNGLQFGMWITVIITGVRMLLSEIIPAFHGIADKVIPNAVPGLDIPLLFPHYPTSVIVGFLSSLVASFIGMTMLSAMHYPIIVTPALIPTFFTGAVTAIFGNSTGGIKGAILGSFINGLILIFGQALLLNYVGEFGPIMRILAETDYALYGPLLGMLLKTIGLI